MEHLIALAHQYLTAQLLHRGLEATGALAILGTIVPKILAWGVPAAVIAADRLASLLLASPARPILLWKAQAICDFLDDLTGALEKIADTFKTRLEADLKAAAAPPETPPAKKEELPAPTPPPLQPPPPAGS